MFTVSSGLDHACLQTLVKVLTFIATGFCGSSFQIFCGVFFQSSSISYDFCNHNFSNIAFKQLYCSHFSALDAKNFAHKNATTDDNKKAVLSQR